MSAVDIQKMVDTIVQHYQPYKVILFGSYAYGQPHAHSDIDLCVVKDDPRSRSEKYAELRILLMDCELPIDIITLTEEQYGRDHHPSFVYYDIKTKGKVLYDSDRSSR